MNIRITKEYLEKQIMKSEYHWITPLILNELVNKAVKVIEFNLEKGNIAEVDDEAMNDAAYMVIDELH